MVAKVYKTLFTQQRSLGIQLTDLKTHVNLAAMDHSELQTACTHDFKLALKQFGWYELKHRVVADPQNDDVEDNSLGCMFMGADPMATADGKPHISPYLEFDVQVSGPNTLHLLLKVATVRFRHAAIAAFAPGANLSTASKEVSGSLCRVMPTSTPAIIDRLREASPEEAEGIDREWAGVGCNLQPGSAGQVVDVRFEEDEDAPITPFPACAVLSFSGFDPVDTKLNSPGVLGVLARLQTELGAASFALFGKGLLAVKEARRWSPKIETKKKVDSGATGGLPGRFRTVAQLSDAGGNKSAPRGPVPTMALGDVIDLNALQNGGDVAEGSGLGRVKKPHARAGPELLAYLAKLEKEEEEAAAAVAAAKSNVALPASMLVAAQKAQDTRAGQANAAQQARLTVKQPMLGSKRALPAAQGGVKKAPAAKKKAAAAAAAAPGEGSAQAAKATKPAVEIDVSSLDVSGLAAAGKLGSLTIPQLKAYCRSIKQPVGGKKADLEARIKAHLGLPVITEQ